MGLAEYLDDARKYNSVLETINNKIENDKELVEKLAELEHNQWVEWSKDLAAKEKLSPERLARWKQFWVPYTKLPEDVKEQDRIWARKVIVVVRTRLESEGYEYGND